MNQLSSQRPVELVTVINSFNRCSLLERAVTSLTNALRVAPFGSAIIVFEAGSTDQSIDFLRKWQDENPADNLMILENPAGCRSFSDGINMACAAAIARFPKCHWLLLYETDNWLGNIEPVVQAVTLLQAQTRLAAAGFTVKQHDGNFFGYGMRFPSALSFALGQNVAARVGLHAPNNSEWQMSDRIRWRTCDIVFTSPLLIRCEAWKQSGGFDAATFPFSDTDLDWAWRCAKLGWKMGVIATEEVVHDNLEQLSAWSANRVLDFHRNRFRLLERHRGKHVALLKPFLFFRHWLETIWLARQTEADPKAEDKLAKRKQMLRTVWTNYW
jgi:GT2 family glycosyltransferase